MGLPHPRFFLAALVRMTTRQNHQQSVLGGAGIICLTGWTVKPDVLTATHPQPKISESLRAFCALTPLPLQNYPAEILA